MMRFLSQFSILQKLTGLSLVFGIALCGIVTYTVLTLRTQATDATLINLAGRQGMLGQKYSKEVLDELSAHQMLASARRTAEGLSLQLRAARSHYAKNVVLKLMNENMEVGISADYQDTKGAIPLPATYFREVSNIVGTDGDLSYRLVSRWNIASDRGLSGPTEERAWAALIADPSSPFTEVVSEKGKSTLVYVSADIGKQGCVECHNGHPGSSKHDFEVGDLMGALVIRSAITEDSAASKTIAAILTASPESRPANRTAMLFESTLDALTNGGTTYSDLSMTERVEIPGTTPEKAQEGLANVKAAWAELMAAVKAARENPFGSPKYVAAVAKFRETNITVLKEMDATVGVMAKSSAGKVDSMMSVELWLMGVVLGLGSLLVLVMVKQIADPLERLSAAIRELADGETDVEIEDRDRGDEIGLIQRAMIKLRDAVIEAQQLQREKVAAQQQSLAAEQMRNREREQAAADRAAEMIQVADGFQSSVGSVIQSFATSVRDMNGSAQIVSTSMCATSSQAHEVETSSSDASDRVRSIAAATEELSASIREIDRQLTESARITGEASEQARASEAVLEELSGASAKIGQVVGLISDIADQTSLLALNATIEAASAGDSGRGFAVVASEVKNLSSQTVRATEEIRGQIDAIQSATVKTADTLRSLGSTVNDIDGIAGSLSTAVQEQSAATSEIARHIEEASRQTQDAQDKVREVTVATAETSGIAEDLSQTAGGLATTADTLEEEVRLFLQRVRAA